MANRKAKPSKKGNAITRPKIAGDVPVSYGELLEDLKVRIRTAQVKAALSVNRQLIGLYWHIGRSIVERQRAEGWGKAVVERLSDDLGREFPKLEGFYNFDFLTLHTDAAERDLEHGLIDHIRKFLLELGAGFAFVGRQVHLEVDGDDFYLDLLFYHLRLRCYMVIDLKARPFKPSTRAR